MDKFTASNGMTVTRDRDGDVVIGEGTYNFVTFKGDGIALALREFFRAERDEELGRWRWPDNPGYVVYARDGGDFVRVARESNGGAFAIQRRDAEAEESTHPAWRAARAFFDAHPERKPWEDAKEGEAWLVTIRGEERPATVVKPCFWIGCEAYNLTDPQITDGRRIWPVRA